MGPYHPLCDDDGTVIGTWWTEPYEDKLPLRGHAALFTRIPLRRSLPAFRRGFKAAFSYYPTDRIWISSTDRVHTIVLRLLGLKQIATLPNSVLIQGVPATVNLFQLQRGDCE